MTLHARAGFHLVCSCRHYYRCDAIEDARKMDAFNVSLILVAGENQGKEKADASKGENLRRHVQSP